MKFIVAFAIVLSPSVLAYLLTFIGTDVCVCVCDTASIRTI